MQFIDDSGGSQSSLSRFALTICVSRIGMQPNDAPMLIGEIVDRRQRLGG